MPDQIYIGNFSKGLKTDRKAFYIDNDAFPTLFDFYVWRGQAKRKRGTLFLGQLTRQIEMVSVPTQPWQFGSLNTNNLITGLGLESSSTITPGSINIIGSGGQVYTEPAIPDGTLIGNAGGTGTINYATGAYTISGFLPITGTFSYYPGLPVMGLRDFSSSVSSSLYPLLLAFDTKYSYQCNQSATTALFYDVTYYKISNVPFTWNGADYQQFWTTNYPSTTPNFSGSLWATNNVPGFHFVNGTSVAAAPSTTINFTFTSNGNPYQTLVLGDRLWFNEWGATSTVNNNTGRVTTIINAALGQYTITFDSALIADGTGIAQLLTNSITGQDGIRWYDGDPTAGTGIPTGSGLGWVNFSPPLTATSVSIDSSPSGLYYLVGALAILPFKDRLLFFSPYIQTSTGPTIQLQDTVLWSWNGTPYYAAPVPNNQTFDPKAYYVDQTGLGGYLPAGISQPIITVSNNEDVLLIGFGGNGRKTRFVYTGNDLQPFLFFNINSELPSSATFSAVPLDKGVIDIGQYGIAMTDQQSSQRVDLDIPDSVFQIQNLNHGVERVNAIRDFYREWIYFTYPVNDSPWTFPTQTFLFNYRDNTWSILYENFTTHGRYRPKNKRSWQTLPFKSWAQWNVPWNAGSSSTLFTEIIAGNPQGYVLIKGQGTGEGKSGTILAISNNGGLTQITSINHCVEAPDVSLGLADYLLIQGSLGTPSINGLIGKVLFTIDANNFVIDLPFPSGTYLGLGTFTRLSQPLIITKQLPAYWEQGRQVRLGVQKYLLDTTQKSQLTVNIYLSQDVNNIWNDPSMSQPSNPLIYSQLMYTCPESANIGLTPANTNLQMPTAISQNQIWHRFNTSLIGDSFQVGLTLSDSQMKNLLYATSEITLHGIQISISPGPSLA